MGNITKTALEDELIGQSIDAAVARNELRALGDFVRAVRNGWKIVLVGGASGLVLGGLLSFAAPVKYVSVAQVMLNTRVSVDTDFTPVESGLPTSITTLESEIEVLRSIDLVERVVDRLDLTNDAEFNRNAGKPADPPTLTKSGEPDPAFVDVPRETTIATVADHRSIEQVGNMSAVYSISFKSADPNKAAILANELAEQYLITSREAKLRSLELSQGWLAERTENLQERLSKLSVKREEHLMAAPYSPDEVETIKARNVSAERRLRAVQADLAKIDETLAGITRNLDAGTPAEAAQYLEMEPADLPDLVARTRAGDAEAETRLRTLIDASRETLTARGAALGAELAFLNAELAQTHSVLVEQAIRDAETRRIENDITVEEAIYQDFVSQLSRRTQQDQYLDAEARIISYARPALTPSEPRRALMALAGLLLATLGCIVALIVREVTQPFMRSGREFEAATGLPLISVIPEVSRDRSLLEVFLNGSGMIDPRLVRLARKLRLSVLAEAAAASREREEPISAAWTASAIPAERTLTASAQPRKQTPPTKAALSRRSTDIALPVPRSMPAIIAGAAANAGDGQSSAMLALALAFADAGETVLLVDLDTENSPFAALRPETGIDPMRLLDNPALAEGLIIETLVPRLFILPATMQGADQAEGFAISKSQSLIAHLATRFDRVLLDTPPLMTRMDTASFQQAANEVILFARWNATTKTEVRGVLRTLNDVGVMPMAVVATRMDLEQALRFDDGTLAHQPPRGLFR